LRKNEPNCLQLSCKVNLIASFVSSKSPTLFVANQVIEWIDFARGC